MIRSEASQLLEPLVHALPLNTVGLWALSTAERLTAGVSCVSDGAALARANDHLADLWSHRQGRTLEAAELIKLSELAAQAVPDEDQARDWDVHRGLLQNAWAAIAYVALAEVHQELRYAQWTVQQTFEAIEYWTADKAPRLMTASEAVLPTVFGPLEEREVQRQARDLRSLLGAEPPDTRRLRERSRREGASLFRA